MQYFFEIIGQVLNLGDLYAITKLITITLQISHYHEIIVETTWCRYGGQG